MTDAPHPRGIVANPEWDAVRERWNERYCDKIMDDAGVDARPTSRSAAFAGRALRTLAEAAACLAVVALVCAMWTGLS